MNDDRTTAPRATFLVDPLRAEQLRRVSRDWPSWDLSAQQLADLELILTGGYNPLRGFMTYRDWESWKRTRRLAEGSPFPAAVRLAVSETCAAAAMAGPLVLRDAEGVAIAILTDSERWRDVPDNAGAGRPWYLGGSLEGLQLPAHYDFAAYRVQPVAVRREIERRGWRRAIAFPTSGFIHRADYERIIRASSAIGGGVVILAIVDPESADAEEPYFRIRALREMLPRFGGDAALLWVASPAPGESRADTIGMHAVVARNAGCTHVYLSEAAADANTVAMVRELGMEPLTMGPRGEDSIGPHIARLLAAGKPIPDELTFPEVARELAARCPARGERGFTIFFTGLSGSGKSTIAKIVRARLLERGGRRVTLLDGDLVRKHLSSELGFSRAHRELNIRRIAFVASEITKNGGVAICSPIAPYDVVRREVRRTIETVGGFVLVFVDTSLDVCEARDRKGLYAKARAGLIQEFTGISDIYERPADAEVLIRTEEVSAVEAADRVLDYLAREGYVPAGHD